MKVLLIILVVAMLASCGHRETSQSIISQESSAIDSLNSAEADTLDSEVVDSLTIFSLTEALRNPDSVTHLLLKDPIVDSIYKLKQLPPDIGNLKNLRVLEFNCIEDLEGLPSEIGRLTNLERLVCDNGNGCAMNIAIPEAIGKLQKLKELVLWGALDWREIGEQSDTSKIKYLPRALSQLKNLQILDIGRNGLLKVPPQIASLKNLKTLRLDYNAFEEVPSFVGNLKNLQELSVSANEHIQLPLSLKGIPGLKVNIGNNALSLAEQRELQQRFPNITFSFSNEYDDARSNEEPDN